MHVDMGSRTIFFHNPKTAGRSTIVSLGLPDDLHLKLVHFDPAEARRCIFQQEWANFFSFCFVRNPWERMVSLYEYHRSLDYAQLLRMNFSHTFARQYDFDEWVCLNDASSRRANWYGVPQTLWMDGVTAVYKMEDYDVAFQEISARMNRDATAIHINRTNHRHYREYYTREESIEAIAAIDEAVIARFGYEF